MNLGDAADFIWCHLGDCRRFASTVLYRFRAVWYRTAVDCRPSYGTCTVRYRTEPYPCRTVPYGTGTVRRRYGTVPYRTCAVLYRTVP